MLRLTPYIKKGNNIEFVIIINKRPIVMNSLMNDIGHSFTHLSGILLSQESPELECVRDAH